MSHEQVTLTSDTHSVTLTNLRTNTALYSMYLQCHKIVQYIQNKNISPTSHTSWVLQLDLVLSCHLCWDSRSMCQCTALETSKKTCVYVCVKRERERATEQESMMSVYKFSPVQINGHKLARGGKGEKLAPSVICKSIWSMRRETAWVCVCVCESVCVQRVTEWAGECRGPRSMCRSESQLPSYSSCPFEGHTYIHACMHACTRTLSVSVSHIDTHTGKNRVAASLSKPSNLSFLPD